MWKREEPARTENIAERSGSEAVLTAAAVAATGKIADRSSGRDVGKIGKSVIIKGELSGSENLTIEGTVEGQIELREHVLTIGTHGKIQAQIFAKAVVVMGHVVGNITASGKINIQESGAVQGDLSAPTVGISEGGQFRGSIDMQRPKAPEAQSKGRA